MSRAHITFLIVVIVILGGFAWVSFRSLRQVTASAKWVTHTREVLETQEALISTLKDAETGQRGYVITGNADYLEPYQKALTNVQQRFDKVVELTRDNVDQQKSAGELKELIDLKLAEMKRIIELRDAQGFEAAQKGIRDNAGKRQMDAIRAKASEMEQEERSLLAERERDSEQSIANAHLGSIVATAAGLVLVAFAFVGLKRDVEMRQAREKEGHEHREWLRVTLSSIGDAVVTTDNAGRINFINPVAMKMMGVKSEDVVNQPLEATFNIVNEMTRTKAENPITRVLREGAIVGLANHTCLIATDGTETPIEDSAAPIKDAEGKILGVVMVFHDVSERRAAEIALQKSRDELEQRVIDRTEQLKEREEHFRVLVQGVTDYAISRLDTEGRVVGWNVGAERITGYSTEEILGKPFEVFYTEEEKKEGIAAAVLKEAQEHGRSEREGPRMRKDGSRFWANAVVSALRDEKQTLRGFAAVTRDITQLKHSEVERQHLLDDLGRKNKELESVIYVTSHDLRSPLVNIQGYSKELARAVQEITAAIAAPSRTEAEAAQLQTTLNTDVPKFVRYILTSTEKMNALLKGLLKLSRLDRQELTLEELNMDEMLGKISDSMRYQLNAANARLTIDPLSKCFGDEMQVNQIFSNLIDNALKYADPARTPEIRVSSIAPDDGEVVYCVSDNGIGIHAEHQKKVFEIFQRLDPKGNVSGDGLGLTLVQRIVERHGGRIWVESAPGTGSKFFVSLPRKNQDNQLTTVGRR